MGHNTEAWIRCDSVTCPIAPNGVILIGRSIESGLRLFEDTGVSRNHCVITFVDGRLEVKDLDSRNGTTVNGQRISVPTQLYHRDAIGVGETQLTVFFELDPDDRSTEAEFTLSP